WFFEYDAPPIVIALLHQACFSELARDLSKKHWAGGEIKKPITVCSVLLVQVAQRLLKPRIKFGIVEVAGDVVHSTDQPLDLAVIHAIGSKQLQALRHHAAERLFRILLARNAHNR